MNAHHKIFCLVLALGLLPVCGQAAEDGPVLARSSLGIEGEVSFDHRGVEILVRTRSAEPELLVRLVALERGRGALGADRYRFAFLGTRIGRFDLRDELVTPEDQHPSAVGLPPLWIEIYAVTPPGAALSFIPPAVDGPLGTGSEPWVLVAIFGALWIIPLAAWLVLRPRRRERGMDLPTAAERLPLDALLRPLVREAAAGRLSPAGKARLERLLIGYWRTRLDLPAGEGLKTLQALKAHPEAGALLSALDAWLHRGPGAQGPESDIESLLAPYAGVAVGGSA